MTDKNNQENVLSFDWSVDLTEEDSFSTIQLHIDIKSFNENSLETDTSQWPHLQ